MNSEGDIKRHIKRTITMSIQYNTHQGYISCSRCNNICTDMLDCLKVCEETLKAGDDMMALDAALCVLVSGVELASCVDNSTGMLTELIMCTYEMIGRCTGELAKQDKPVRDKALTLITREARKGVFNGWTDWRYNLMECGICLCDEKKAKTFERVLDELLEGEQEDYYPEYNKEEDIILRYLLHRQILGREAAREELYHNISVDRLRRMAIEDALEEKDYDEAERLCREKAEGYEAQHYRKNDPEDWQNVLYSIYDKSADRDKKIAQAQRLLLMGNESFWDELKEIYETDGTWDTHYEELLELLKNSGQRTCYRNVLVTEEEGDRLLQDLTEDPQDLFEYGVHLVKDYPDQIYEMCCRVIRDNCARYKERPEYKRVMKQITMLIQWGGGDCARSLIGELKRTYPRKPALQDELQKVESLIISG